ncbi:hypothetical protein ACFDTO_16395 [Microbacteriaceae bacterium 4G12]
MNYFLNHIGKPIIVKLSGEIDIYGTLLDKGSDILVLYNGKDYLYIPLLHIQRIIFEPSDEITSQYNIFPLKKKDVSKEEFPIQYDSSISLRKTLQHAKGMFIEIAVSSNQTLHGYVTHIMNNYFVFYSPVYKTTFIPFQHLKWLIPYEVNQSPYCLTREELPLQPSTMPLARTFEEQLKRLIGKMIILDLGNAQEKIGKLEHVHDAFIELTIARNETVYLSLLHIKAVHCP